MKAIETSSRSFKDQAAPNYSKQLMMVRIVLTVMMMLLGLVMFLVTRGVWNISVGHMLTLIILLMGLMLLTWPIDILYLRRASQVEDFIPRDDNAQNFSKKVVKEWSIRKYAYYTFLVLALVAYFACQSYFRAHHEYGVRFSSFIVLIAVVLFGQSIFVAMPSLSQDRFKKLEAVSTLLCMV